VDRDYMPVKVGLSFKGSLMSAARFDAAQEREVYIVDMRLESTVCLKDNLAAASWPGTFARPSLQDLGNVNI
jgi:hypothetical protein